MPDPDVRDIGHAEGTGGLDVHIGADSDTVTLTIAGAQCRLASAAAEEFARLFVSACWQAARQVPGDG